MKAKNESEIENCFRTTILKGQWGRGAGRKLNPRISCWPEKLITGGGPKLSQTE